MYIKIKIIMDKINNSDFISKLKDVILQYEKLYSKRSYSGKDEDTEIGHINSFQKWFLNPDVGEKYFNYLVETFNKVKTEEEHPLRSDCLELIGEIQNEETLYVDKLEKLARLIDQYINELDKSYGQV
jgi:hypothetical protein